jgi:hypothetical protein
MTNKVSFFIPIKYSEKKTFSQYTVEGVENYFYLKGKSIYVIDGKHNTDIHEIEIQNKNQIRQVILIAIKIISYMTIIIPLIMLSFKVAFRTTHNFNIINTSNKTDQITQTDHTVQVNQETQTLLLTPKNQDTESTLIPPHQLPENPSSEHMKEYPTKSTQTKEQNDETSKEKIYLNTIKQLLKEKERSNIIIDVNHFVGSSFIASKNNNFNIRHNKTAANPCKIILTMW